MTDFASYMTNVATAVGAVETVIQNAQAIYSKAAEIVTAAEAAFVNVSGAGATKKAIVMAGISVFVAQLGQAWDSIKGMISAFIDATISAYKAITAVAAPAPAPAPQA